MAAALRDSAGRERARHASHITYEVRIATVEDERPKEVVYHREGIVTAEHTLEVPLRRGARYYWTVRARYECDGRPCVTEWGATHPLGRAMAEVPSVFSYRFKVGGEKGR
jgi:hypothetical protein